jgi:hypothetical protein
MQTRLWRPKAAHPCSRTHLWKRRVAWGPGCESLAVNGVRLPKIVEWLMPSKARVLAKSWDANTTTRPKAPHPYEVAHIMEMGISEALIMFKCVEQLENVVESCLCDVQILEIEEADWTLFLIENIDNSHGYKVKVKDPLWFLMCVSYSIKNTISMNATERNYRSDLASSYRTEIRIYSFSMRSRELFGVLMRR